MPNWDHCPNIKHGSVNSMAGAFCDSLEHFISETNVWRIVIQEKEGGFDQNHYLENYAIVESPIVFIFSAFSHLA